MQARSYSGENDEKQEIADELNKRGIEFLPQRLSSYALAIGRTSIQADYLRSLIDQAEALEHRTRLRHMAEEMCRCGRYLGFKHYYTINELRLHSGHFCQLEKMCPLCARRRASKVLRTYTEKTAQLLRDHPELVGCMVTLTVRDGPDLAERLNHLLTAHTRAIAARKRSNHGQAWTEWARAEAGVSRVEIKRGSNSGEWHPHIHSAWLCERLPDENQLRQEWHDLTGDSHQVKVSPFRVCAPELLATLRLHPELFTECLARDLIEVLKYSVKSWEMTPADSYETHLRTRGKKLIRPFGLLHGVKVPDGCLDDPLTDTELPYVELFFRYEAGKFI